MYSSAAPARTGTAERKGSPGFGGESPVSRGVLACRLYRLGFLCLGVMCVLQASLNVTLRLLSSRAEHRANLTGEAERLEARLGRLTGEKVLLQTRYEQLSEELDRTRAQMRNCEAALQRRAETAEKTCPAGWRRRGSSMYYVSEGTKSWSQSREDCRERGSDLVIISSVEEQRFIQELELQVWIGLSKIKSTWTWVDGSTLTSGFWRTGEPNEYRSGEDCAESKPDYGSLNTWNDERCHTYLNWVCEREAC
ncbi:C-type lectin domain family 10 member A-like [Salminus brasiliensis]|uniref:C-type lectin domain family 10 member A-like n=1 Tax=Salminus brasiliensis TaxID=930266 RepID=UPI003B838FDC